MSIFIPLLALALLAAQAAPAESRSETLYTDGTLVEQEAAATRGAI